MLDTPVPRVKGEEEKQARESVKKQAKQKQIKSVTWKPSEEGLGSG